MKEPDMKGALIDRQVWGELTILQDLIWF